MKRTTPKQKIFFLTLPTVLMSQMALAHTEIPYQVTEGNTADIAVAIGHACELTVSGKPNPVIAQSVVFPTLSPELSATDSQGNPVASPASIGEITQQVLGVTGLAHLIQSKDIFTVQNVKNDSLGNSIGFYGKTGSLAVNLEGRVPFAFTAPNFQPTSCAKKLNIEVAVADICVASKPYIQAPKVNLWIPNNGSNYARLGSAAGVDGIGEPAVLQVNRDLVNNPLDAACGDGIDVTVTPSALDLDTNLSIPGYWAAK